MGLSNLPVIKLSTLYKVKGEESIPLEELPAIFSASKAPRLRARRVLQSMCPCQDPEPRL